MSFGSIKHGNKFVTTAGTAVPLAAVDTPCKLITINAKAANTGKIAVGGQGVIATIGVTQTGVILNAGDVYELEVADLNEVYIDATVSGEGVTFTYLG